MKLFSGVLRSTSQAARMNIETALHGIGILVCLGQCFLLKIGSSSPATQAKPKVLHIPFPPKNLLELLIM